MSIVAYVFLHVREDCLFELMDFLRFATGDFFSEIKVFQLTEIMVSNETVKICLAIKRYHKSTSSAPRKSCFLLVVVNT